ncbi:hypothetical protein BH11PSE8_BH11PSE8_01530 [soil metagenome]|jgi:hypothetical protein
MPLAADYDDDPVRDLVRYRVPVNESNRKGRPLDAADSNE